MYHQFPTVFHWWTSARCFSGTWMKQTMKQWRTFKGLILKELNQATFQLRIEDPWGWNHLSPQPWWWEMLHHVHPPKLQGSYRHQQLWKRTPAYTDLLSVLLTHTHVLTTSLLTTWMGFIKEWLSGFLQPSHKASSTVQFWRKSAALIPSAWIWLFLKFLLSFTPGWLLMQTGSLPESFTCDLLQTNHQGGHV